MLKINLIASLRFLSRNKGFTMLNVVGLSIGMTFFIITLFFLSYETTYDRFFTNKENIYRINISFGDNSGNVSHLVNSPPAMSPFIQGRYPELKRTARLRYAMSCLLQNGDKSFNEDHGFYADSLFLEILSYPLLSGEAASALDEPNSIVLTSDMASKYFGDVNPLGATLILNRNTSLKVTGVLAPLPLNSHLDFNFLISFPTYVVPPGYSSDLESWDWLGFITYVELNNDADPKLFESKLVKLFRDRTPKDETPVKPALQLVTDIYLGSSELTDDLASNIRSSNNTSVYTLFIISILILFISGFNFSNLVYAMATSRYKSVGIRKVVGAQKGMIIRQLLTENFILILFCLLIAFSLSMALLPLIGTQLNWAIDLTSSNILSSVPIVIAIILSLWILSGYYPAFMLSKTPIMEAIKGKAIDKGTSSFFSVKNMLVMIQFSISIGLICSTLVLINQVNYVSNRSMGFDRENVLILKALPEEMSRHYKAFKQKLLEHTEVVNVTRSDRSLGEAWPFSGIVREDQSEDQFKMTFFNAIDYDYFETMGIDLISGRTFSEVHVGDSVNAVIINQTAATLLGLENPIGERVHFFDLDGPRTIIGVVKDFNYTSLHQPIGPVAMVLPFINVDYINVRLASGRSLQGQIDLVKNVWNETSSGTPIEWSFLDNRINQLYKSEQRLSQLVGIYAIIGVLLACMGLFGIVMFMINKRLKELGIRKILGASVFSIYALFAKPYLLQLAISMIIAIPIVHYYLSSWLSKFAYHIEISWWLYPASAFILTIIALLTITMRTMWAAKLNPLKVLKSE